MLVSLTNLSLVEFQEMYLLLLCTKLLDVTVADLILLDVTDLVVKS